MEVKVDLLLQFQLQDYLLALENHLQLALVQQLISHYMVLGAVLLKQLITEIKLQSQAIV